MSIRLGRYMGMAPDTTRGIFELVIDGTPELYFEGTMRNTVDAYIVGQKPFTRHMAKDQLRINYFLTVLVMVGFEV